MKKLTSFLFVLAAFFSASGAIQTKSAWNDSVKICIIWNEGTGTDAMPLDWPQKTGEIGDSTRSFVLKSLSTVKQSNIKVFTGTSPEWSSISQSVANLKKEFGGELPDVIAYINAGYEWDQTKKTKSTTPFKLLKEASDSGVGIVAIGDDAAYDAKTIFPLTGYKGKGAIIQLHDYDDDATSADETGGLPGPYMSDGVIWEEDWDAGGWKPTKGFPTLKIALNPSENKKLPDEGILRGVTATSLNFKTWQKNGRGQADADVWDIDNSKLDIPAAVIGIQSGKSDEGDIPPAATPDLYKVIAALQAKLNRVVMLCYQPQFIQEVEASQQIVYNSMFWASKAKEMLKIEMPTATPPNGSPNVVKTVLLKVGFPSTASLYKIRYQLDDGSWNDYNTSIALPIDGSDVTVRACAIPTDPKGNYTPSDTATFIYEYAGGPVLESARIIPGSIDLSTSQRAEDTLLVTFSKEMKDFTSTKPFISKDKNGINYQFTLKELSQSGKEAKFVITTVSVMTARYLPKDREDSLAIDPAAKLSDVDGTVQDGTTNRYVVVQVDGIKKPKIATPEADPSSGNTQTVKTVKLSVKYPTDAKLYTLRYQIDGNVTNSSSEYTGAITLPKTGSNITIKAVAISRDTDLWETSDTMTVTYEYVGGPVIETAELIPGSIQDYQTSKFGPDTLLIRFNKEVNTVSYDKPFISFDNGSNEYRFQLKYIETAGQYMRFERIGTTGKPAGYIPETLKDSLRIDVNAKIIGKDGIVQDDANNRMVPLTVRERAIPKIATPKANPNSGNTQSVKKIAISVEYPGDQYYTVRYAINGSAISSSDELPSNGEITLPAGAKADIKIEVIAFSDSTHLWRTSDPLTVTYEYVAPPVIDSAIYSPGSLKDYATSEMNPDTLRIVFDQEVNNISTDMPFISNDKDGNRYTFRLRDSIGTGKSHIYLVEKAEGKPDGYLPEHLKDQITIDVAANVIASKTGVVQDGSNNVTVPLIVKPVPSNVKVSTIWYDGSKSEMSGLKEKLDGFENNSGILVLVDPQARFLESEWERYTGTMMIYDALGHRILGLSSIKEGTDAVECKSIVVNGRSQFAILWNGTNEGGRRVGTGAYLGVVTITDANGRTVQVHETLPVPAHKKE